MIFAHFRQKMDQFDKNEIRFHAVGKARAGCSAQEIIDEQQRAYGEAGLKKSQVYDILKAVKKGENMTNMRGRSNSRPVRNDELVSAVESAISEDRRLQIAQLATLLDTSTTTIHRIIHEDLNLVKKSARWVPRLLDDDQKKERVRCSTEFLNRVSELGESFVRNIITMDESAVALHTPETKQRSKQWLPKGTPGPLKAKVQASRDKVMILAFFDCEGMIYTRIAEKGAKINSDYMIETVRLFLRRLRQKRRELYDSGDWLLHWDNCPIHKSRVVSEFIQEMGIKLLQHPPYSPDLAPADFFLFPKVKDALSGLTLTRDSFKGHYDGVIQTISKEDFLAAFKKWISRNEKCIRIRGDYVEKC